jgi:hypothetical protein
VDLPTYTNIWRIEKRLYKLYDFRLPAPLPITWIAVFAGITVPYVVFLVAIGLPFNHNLVWLYVLPPGLLTWLTTRPVIENKRLPELVSSQLRYLSEPRTWCRMAPFSEKDHIALSARVWNRNAAQARAEKTRAEKAARSRGPSRLRETARPAPAPGRSAGRATASVPAPVGSAAQAAVPPTPTRQARRPVQAQVATEPAAARSAQPMAPASTPSAPTPERAAPPASVVLRATGATGGRGTSAGWPWPGQVEPDAPSDPRREGARWSAWPTLPADQRQDSRALEVSHDDPEPDLHDLGEPRPAPLGPPPWPPPTGTFPIPGAPEPITFPEAGPFPETGAFPEVSAFPEATAFPEAAGYPEATGALVATGAPGATAFPGLGLGPEPVPVPAREADPVPVPVNEADPEPEPAVLPETWPAPDPIVAADPVSAPVAAYPTPAPVTPAPEMPAPAARPAAGRPGRSIGARVAALFVDFEGDRPVPSVERALSGPGSGTDASWNRRVKVVAGGQGPGQRDLQTLDRDRARLPLAGHRLIVVLGCTSGAGQSSVAVMTALILAAVRDAPVAALDLNPGDDSIAARIAPAASFTALLAGEVPRPAARTGPDAQPLRGDWRARSARRPSAARLDVIADPPDTAGYLPDGHDFQRLASLLTARYPLTVIDPAPSRLARALSVADQLVLVAPVSPDAAGALANTQQWLIAHGYGEVAARAVTVINGVGRRPSEDVLRAESVAKGRCRAIIRVPWDGRLPVHLDGLAALDPQSRLAYTALAGVIVSGLAASREGVPGRSPGDHSR